VSVVRINAITVPPERVEEFERRFANRAGEVSKSPGFEAFELLRPTDGRDVFLVYTRWRSEDDFMAWVNSAAFQHGHKAHSQGGPVGTASELWSFEVIQREGASQAEATTGSGAG
jgi:heme-degrading monooxygenase HmoA